MAFTSWYIGISNCDLRSPHERVTTYIIRVAIHACGCGAGAPGSARLSSRSGSVGWRESRVGEAERRARGLARVDRACGAAAGRAGAEGVR